jgi:hypothetical protein
MPTALQELLSQPVLLPSPFLEEAAKGFADQVAEYKKTVSELEQVRGSCPGPGARPCWAGGAPVRRRSGSSGRGVRLSNHHAAG